MRSDWSEERVRQLYRELKRQDERLLPSFARNWETALSRVRGPRRPGRLLPIAASLALLMVLGGSAGLFFSREGSADRELQVLGAAMSPSGWRSPTVILLRSPVEPWPRADRELVASGRLSDSRVWVPEWSSPTDFLMRSPLEPFRTLDGES